MHTMIMKVNIKSIVTSMVNVPFQRYRYRVESPLQEMGMLSKEEDPKKNENFHLSGMEKEILRFEHMFNDMKNQNEKQLFKNNT